jgi:glycosyltransferase involved in cell wall biosynthesis
MLMAQCLPQQVHHYFLYKPGRIVFIKVDTPPAISVIVPVYNVQDYIAECLDSLAKQTFNNRFEILLIDDCSTDNSKQLCEDFVATYPHLAKLICHTENKGLSVVRNTGVAAAKGDYFTFVDSDDSVPDDALQHLYDGAITYQADIVKGNNTIFNEKGSRPADYNVRKVKVYAGDTILSIFMRHKETRGHTWGKLFRSANFKQITNTPGVAMAQDTLYCAEVFSLAKKLVLIDKTVYHYRLRKTGATGRKFQTGAYLWWLYSIENCSRFISTEKQQICHKELQIRTLLQLVREARTLNNSQLADVVKEIHARQQAWQLTSLRRLVALNISAKALLHFLKFKFTLFTLDQRLQN